MHRDYKVITAGSTSLDEAAKLLTERVRSETVQGWEPLGGVVLGPSLGRDDPVWLMQSICKVL